MGDPIVSSVINQVMQQSKSLASQDFAVLWGLKSDLRSLRIIFTQIQSVLTDAEIKQRTNTDLQIWLRKLRAASFQVENVLEEVSTEALLRRLHVERGIKNKVSTFFSASNPLQFRIRMVQKVKEIKELLDSIAAERIQFGLKQDFGCNLEASVDVNDTMDVKLGILTEYDVIGRYNEKEMLVESICNGNDSVSVCAIWGIGGLGKTTLARIVYNDLNVKNAFELKVWLCVSSDFSSVKLLSEILRSVEGDSFDLLHTEMESLQLRIQETLQGRRLLLVLDGIENNNEDEWNKFMEILRCGCRSTVIITTRSMKLADMMATHPTLVYPLSFLSENDSWLLFKRYAFGVHKDVDSLEFEKIGKQIVNKCDGLPLAVKVIGSLMCFKSRESEWLSVLNSNVWDMADECSHTTRILPPLKLSYDNLPPYMRQCFALCSIFPKGHEMDKQLLVELWVAYGFVPTRGDADLYDLGEEIFNSLVWRSFLQDVEECIFDGITTCKMHDEMHSLAQSVMKHECSSIISGEKLKFPEEVLHLSSNDILYLSNDLMEKAKSLRSLVTLGGLSSIPTPDYIFEQRYLRVLHLGSSSDMLTDLPESVGNLKFLRYLNVSRSKIAVLPKSIVQLQNLQTLKLTFCENLCELPEGIRYMRNLRHLNIHGCCSLDHMPLGMGQLRHLRRLSTFIVGRRQGVQINELQELNLLGGELSITGLINVRDSSQAERCNMKKKQNINCLTLSWDCKNNNSENELLENNSEEILEALQPHMNLKTLTISDYQGLYFPNWIASLVNLVTISFEKCRRCEKLPAIGKLPFLKVLELKEMEVLKYLDDEEHENEDSFPCLEKLVINDCPNVIELPYIPKLKLLRIEGFEDMVSLSDDMFQNVTGLEELQVFGCPNLSCLPEVIRNLEGLKALVIGDCDLLKVSLEKDIGVDWYKIAHLPYVKIDDQVLQKL